MCQKGFTSLQKGSFHAAFDGNSLSGNNLSPEAEAGAMGIISAASSTAAMPSRAAQVWHD